MSKKTENPHWKFVKNILISIVLTSIFSKIIEPLLEFIYASFLKIGGNVINAISNSTYKEISNGFSDQPSMLVLNILFVAVVCIFNILLNELTTARNDRLESLNNVVSEKTAVSIEESQKSTAITVESLHASLDMLSKGVEELKKKNEVVKQKIYEQANQLKKETKRDYKIICLLLTLLFTIFLFLHARVSFINSTITKTTTSIEIVAPYITDQQYKQLKSDFHCIENQSDYNLLWEDLNSIAEQYSLTLK